MSTGNLRTDVINALKTVYDPELPVNIYDLGLIYAIDIDKNESSVHIQMTLTSPMCPVAQTFPEIVQQAVLKLAWIRTVSVELVWEPPWSKDNLTDEIKLELNLI